MAIDHLRPVDRVSKEGAPLQRLLVTGFGPFKDVADNPSATLARGCGLPQEVLDVSYEAVQQFLERVDAKAFDALLMLGVHGRAVRMHLELLAHNWAGDTPDVRDVAFGPKAIRAGEPPVLAGTLWQGLDLGALGPCASLAQWSYHPGSYLCNFVYYEALRRFPAKRVGFLHVPTLAALPIRAQEAALESILKNLSGP